ncbi:MAG: rhomboid family intramembrane serine protease [Verrucomicrobia bacterium]|nr:rhomboid family intramembrane serine protease [Verrucomicrobiota bacterium]
MNWKKIFDSVGMNGTQWQWRILRLERRVKDFFKDAGRRGKQVAYRHKFCPECGALIDRSFKRCPECDARVPSWTAQFIRRVFALALPSWCPVTVLILFTIVAMEVAKFFFPGAVTIAGAGAFVAARFSEGEVWRIVTYILLHGGIWHLVFNALALSQVGPLLEEELGSRRFFVIFILTGVGAALAQMLAGGNPESPMVGASGSLFGLIGFGASYSHFYGGARGKEMRAFFLQWAMYGILFGFIMTSGGIARVANGAHIGGFLGGVAMGFALEKERVLGSLLEPLWTILFVAVLAATAAAIVWNILAAFPG